VGGALANGGKFPKFRPGKGKKLTGPTFFAMAHTTGGAGGAARGRSIYAPNGGKPRPPGKKRIFFANDGFFFGGKQNKNNFPRLSGPPGGRGGPHTQFVSSGGQKGEHQPGTGDKWRAGDGGSRCSQDTARGGEQEKKRVGQGGGGGGRGGGVGGETLQKKKNPPFMATKRVITHFGRGACSSAAPAWGGRF